MTDAELAILSIIAEAPITGYDLQSVLNERNIRSWTLIGTRSVYYVIDKLESQGLIEATNENEIEHQRDKTFRLTSAGVGILQTAITDRLSTPHHLPYSFDIGLANLRVLKTTQVRHSLKSYRAGLQTQYDHLVEQLDHLSTQNIPFHIVSMFEHQIALLEAEMVWFDKWYESWETQAPQDEPPVVAKDEDMPRMQQLILPQDEDSFHKHSTRDHRKKDEIAPEDLPPPPKRRRASGDETVISKKNRHPEHGRKITET